MVRVIFPDPRDRRSGSMQTTELTQSKTELQTTGESMTGVGDDHQAVAPSLDVHSSVD